MLFGFQIFNAGTQFFVQLLFILFMIFLGIRRSGVALGLIGGLGVLCFAFIFHAKPGSPPIDVMLIILSVVLASATLQASGGMDYLVQIAERILRSHPKYITIMAPFVTYFFTMLVGTGHGVYTLQPVIFDVAYKTGVRPERPMAASAVSSQMGITASPIAAAVVGVVALINKGQFHVTVPEVLMVTVPCTFVGVLLLSLWSFNRGKDLHEDTAFQERMKDDNFRNSLESSSISYMGKKLPQKAKLAVGLFFVTIATIVVLAIWGNEFMPAFDEPAKVLPMTTVLQFLMLACGALIVFCTDTNAKKISQGTVFNAGMIALATIFGIAWMSDTFINANKPYLVDSIGIMVKDYPWTFALATFCVSAFVKSQAATLTITIPLGLSLNLPLYVLLSSIPASYAYFFFCFYPSDLAAINFDRTGTTRIGKYLLNHSFMIPGLIGVVSASILAHFIAKIVVGFY